MRHSYLRIEEVDEGESKCKMKTINKNKNMSIVKRSVTYFEWFSIGGHYDEFRNTAI